MRSFASRAGKQLILVQIPVLHCYNASRAHADGEIRSFAELARPHLTSAQVGDQKHASAECELEHRRCQLLIVRIAFKTAVDCRPARDGRDEASQEVAQRSKPVSHSRAVGTILIAQIQPPDLAQERD